MNNHPVLKFELNQRAKLVASGERGVIKGCAFYIESEFGEPQYSLRYVDARGCACHGWFTESDIEPDTDYDDEAGA